jgi:Tfp pilus assembly protein PilO
MKNWLQKLVEFLSSFDKKKTLIALVGAGVVLALDVAIILRAQIGAVAKISPEIFAKKKEIDTLQRNLREMQDFIKGDGSTKQRAAKVKEFATEDQIPQLLEQLTALCNARGIKLLQINSARVEPANGAVKSAGKRSSKKEPVAPEKTTIDDKFQSTLISLELVGDYHDVGQFLEEVEGLKFMIEVKELRISTDIEDLRLQNVNLVLNAYVKK